MARTRRGLGWAAVVVLAILMIASMVAVFFLGRSWKTDSVSSSPTITEIQKLGELVVLRVSVADVLEDAAYEYKGIWIVRGDAQVAVDLRLAQLQSADEKTKKLVVVLPPPKVIQPRVDLEKSKIFEVVKTTLIPFVGDRDKLTNQGWSKAQRMVESACTDEGFIDQARGQTELVLTNMYRLVGWDVDIVWQDGSETSKTAQ